MKPDKKNMSWKEVLKINHRAYMIFYKKYPGMITSRISLIIWKALAPYVGIYFSALIIEELSGNRSIERLRFLVLTSLLSAAGISLVSALLEKCKNTRSAGIGLKIKRILSEKLFDMDYIDLDDTKTMDLYTTILQNLNGQGWGLYRVLENYETLCSALVMILGGLSLTFSLFTSHVPETAGKYVILNEPLFLIFLIAIMLLITWISPQLAGKAEKYWAMCSNLHTLGNRMFGYYGHLRYDSKKAADVRIYC